MDRFLKRKGGSGNADENGSVFLKRQKKNPVVWGTKEPAKVIAWNCNGLTARVRSGDTERVKAFIKRERPDIFFLSEVRVAAANNASSGKPGPHTKWFRGRMRENDKKSCEDAAGVNAFLNSEELSEYKVYFSLANSKYAGTALFIRRSEVQKPMSVRYNLEDDESSPGEHDTDGRVIFVSFPSFSILHTYSPNNGWESPHFNRRKAWDEKVRDFMLRQKDKETPVIWMGDLNVAPEDSDLSHPGYFRRQILGRNAKGKPQDIAPENRGQPGCTDGERERFRKILSAGDLVDAFKELRKNSDSNGDTNTKERFTWRGATNGKNGGMGMRIDHCIVSNSLAPKIKSFSILGHGVERHGFMGSDHSPISFELLN